MHQQLLSALFAVVFATAAKAQVQSAAPDLPGNYTLLTRQGLPPNPGATTTLVVVPTAVSGVYTGVAYVDYGSGPAIIPEQCAVIVGGAGAYSWRNTQNHTGTISWSGDQWVSIVTSGPATGLVRRLVPIV